VLHLTIALATHKYWRFDLYVLAWGCLFSGENTRPVSIAMCDGLDLIFVPTVSWICPWQQSLGSYVGRIALKSFLGSSLDYA